MFKDDLNLSRKLVWSSIFFIFGIVAGYFTDMDYLWSMLALIGLGILTLFLYFFAKYNIKVLLLLIVFVAGVTWIDFMESDLDNLQQWQQQDIRITGQVAEIIPRDYQIVVDIFHINGESFEAGKVVVKMAWGDSNEYRWGDNVEFEGLVEKPLPQVNPGGFSEQDYWRQKGVGYLISASREGRILEKAGGIKKLILLARERIYELINNNLPSDEGGILIGLLLGDKKAINEDFYSTAQKMGIAHVFAVSGLHVGVVLALYLGVVRLLKLKHSYVIIGALILLGCYSLLVGFTPSVVRASIMGFLGILAVSWLRYKDFYTIIAAAAWIILLADPLTIFNIGFQLSFITTLGLFYFTPLAQRLFNFLPPKWALILAVPIAAQLGSLPITLYYFNTLSLLAPLMNLIVVPIVSLLVPLLFIALFLGTIWVKLAQPFVYLAGGIAYTLSQFIDYFTQVFSQGHVFLARPPLIFIVFYYLFIIFLREMDKFKDKLNKVPFKIKLSIIIIPILLLLMGTLPRELPLEVAFLDVGQGDGAVLRTPHKQYVVIDGGPGSTTISQYLRFQGANKIALVVLSHPDSDHINGIYNVLKEFKVETILVPPDVEQTEELRILRTMAKEKETRIVEGRKGMSLKLTPEINFRVLAPDIDKLIGLDKNNASLIINCTYGKQDFLFTGDVDKEIVEELLPLNRDIEVIKIPHHGSRGSYLEGFYQEVKPDVAVISVGRGNRYGHPHSEVLQGLDKVGTKVYRTDQQGAIIFSTDGDKLWVRTMLEVKQ